MIRGAVFDLDGTLLDSNPYWGKAPAVYLASLGKEAAPDIAETVFCMTVPETIEYMIRTYDLAVSPEEVAAGIDTIMENFYRFEIPVKDGVPALLSTCKERGIPCAIASVTDRPLVEASLRRFGLLSCFDALVTTADVGVGKHKPDVYFRAAACLGSSASETLVFEDALHALQTAKRAGFRTVGVYDRAMEGRTEEVMRFSDCYLKDFSDLSALIRALDK